LHRYSEVLGLPVICTADGKNLGTIKDIIFCPKEKSVVAFLIECKVTTEEKGGFCFGCLSLGRDALIVMMPMTSGILKKFCTDRNLRIKGYPGTSHIHKKWGRPGNGKGRIV